MKKIIVSVFVTVSFIFCGVSFAEEPIPITADQAFDAVQNQKDPVSGQDTKVVLVDVRTRAEYFWVGAACQVDEIIDTDGNTITPNNGKVLYNENESLTYNEDQTIDLVDVSSISLSPIAINIPYKLWNEKKGSLYFNNKFRKDVEELAYDDEYKVIIFFCRSGGRSEDCLGDFDTTLFDAIYEIDQPDGKSGRGGFEGTSYSNAYNGYRGFPNRKTEFQDHPSVSWKDTGLPIKTSVNPLTE